jgi:hypothetical protein
MKKITKVLIFLLLAIVTKTSVGQGSNSDWIDFTQPYFKVQVEHDGIYKIDHFELSGEIFKKGLDVLDVDPRKIQMFRNGVEIPIVVIGEDDGVFGAGDHILFYGEKNKGELDKWMYKKADHQVNPYFSMYTDTASYFITYADKASSKVGLRLNPYNNSNYALPVESYYMHEEVAEYHDIYSYGKPFIIFGVPFNFAEYKEGEGWVGPRFGINQGSGSRVEAIKTLGVNKSGTPKALLEFRLMGLSNDVLNNNDHRVRMEVGQNPIGLTSVFDTTFEGYTVVSKSMELSLNYIGAINTYFEFIPEVVPKVGTHGNALAYLKLTYPRNFDFLNETAIECNLPAAGTNRHLKFSNYGNGVFKDPIVFDLENQLYISTKAVTGSEVEFVIPSGISGSKLVIDDYDILTNLDVKGIDMFDPSTVLTNCEFNIVTSESMVGPELQEYVNYRKTKFASTSVTVEQLYNSFSFGVKHPLAIRGYCDYILENYNGQKPEYLLLIGRGFENQLFRNNVNNTAAMKVPTLGQPASDHLFSSEMHGAEVEPALATGRLAFDNRKDIGVYLDKLKSYENPAGALWKKSLLHLGGGKDGSQANVISNFLNSLEPYPEGPPYGGTVEHLSKAAAGVQDAYVKERSIGLINQGLNMITFLGHGSTTFLDLDIGDTTDLFNEDKYPIYFFNGCTIGNPNLGNNSNGEIFYSEKIIKATRKGGIAFLGQSATSELGHVSELMREFYKGAYQLDYGKSIGRIMANSIDRNNKSSGDLRWIHNTQMYIQGDPAIKLYSPALTDYSISAENIFVYPENAIALSDSFALAVIVENLGKTPTDSVIITLKRTYPDGITSFDYQLKVAPIEYKDTVLFWIKSKDAITAGPNYLDAHVNPDEKVDEVTYLNNRVSNHTFNMPSNGINPLYPLPFDIVGGDSVELIVNAMDLSIINQGYIFKIDTASDFNSPWSDSVIVNGGSMARHKFELFDKDSVVYYWKCRLTVGETEGGAFVERSFTNIKGHPSGWSQAHFPQFDDKSNNVEDDFVLDGDNRRMDFDKLERRIWVDTDRYNSKFKGVKLAGGFNAKDINSGIAVDGIVAMLFNKYTLELEYHPTMIPTTYWGNDPPNTSSKQIYYVFQKWFTSQPGSSGQDSFKKFINGIEEGTYVALFSHKSFGNNYWANVPEMFDLFNDLGAVKLDPFRGDQTSQVAYVLVGQKGAEPGSAYEDVAVYQSGYPGSGYASIEGKMFGKGASGNIMSERIGPASQWGAVYHNVEKENTNDSFHLTIYGHKNNGELVKFYPDFTTNGYDFSSVDADIYPYISLQSNFYDYVERTAAQLKNWRVTYSGIPEGLINTNINYVNNNNKDTLLEGDSFYVNVAFQNVSRYPMDSVLGVANLVEVGTRTIITTDTIRTKPLGQEDYDFYTNSFATNGLEGNYNLVIKFNPDYEQPEYSLVNNTLNLPFFVKVDKFNPILDVTFDGKHIINGDIVSAKPTILITSNDENPVLLQNDSNDITIELKYPGSSTFTPIDISGSMITFFPASDENNNAVMEFVPGELDDGVYILRVQSIDKNGNKAGDEPYEISFKVIKATTVSNFYPYPNPFTSNTRFVFTLTGSEVPDYINIKIMNVSGRVVKEISKEELGDITVGNNITSYRWDGTDEFGDKLANGVYLYTVTVKHAGKEVDKFATAGDGSFKQNVGKLYILR